jgi:hypothetical protein
MAAANKEATHKFVILLNEKSPLIQPPIPSFLFQRVHLSF